LWFFQLLQGHLEPAALQLLEAYSWPGNVRQLENTVFRAIVLCEGDTLEIQDFPQIASLVQGFEVKIPPAPAAPVKAQAAVSKGVGAVSDGVALGIPVVTEGGHIRKLEEV
jgi:DNA-binding NtrC family response regulator